MNLEEIFELWQQDSNISQTDLGNESLNIPKLHHKYYQILARERAIMRKLESDYKRLYSLKQDWCMGAMDKETLDQLGWEPQPRKFLKSELDSFIEADKQVVKLNLSIVEQKDKIDVLESIIKTINNRGFHIKNAIDWLKFTSGQ